MPRAPRAFDIQLQYHLMVRGSNKSTVFRDEEDYQTYYRLILQAKHSFRMRIYHYVLMPNHGHIQFQPSRPTIAGFLRFVQWRYSRYFSKKYGIAGHIWQGHPKCKAIETESYSTACGIYIEHNPVRAGIVKSPGDWPYSSYNFYAFGRPDPLVDVDPMYRELGATPAARQASYRQKVGGEMRSVPTAARCPAPGAGHQGAGKVDKWWVPVAHLERFPKMP